MFTNEELKKAQEFIDRIRKEAETDNSSPFWDDCMKHGEITAHICEKDLRIVWPKIGWKVYH